jgi:SAM-dependent methyltransferase
MFQSTQNADYIATVSARIAGDYLTWCEQFLDLLEPMTRSFTESTLNDIGCCAGQFYKSLKRRGLPIAYRGYDIEPAYIDVAMRHFPELAEKVHVWDIEVAPPPTADLTIISATLEHLTDPMAALQALLETTHRCLLVRTFVGESSLDQWLHKPGAMAPYRIRQFREEELLGVFKKEGFGVEVIDDRYTASKPVKIAEGIVRVQKLFLASRPS